MRFSAIGSGLSATQVSTSHRGATPCLAVFKLYRKHSTGVSDVRIITKVLVGQPAESLLCFTLTGEEHVDGSRVAPKKHGDDHSFSNDARLQSRSKWRVPFSSESMLKAGVVYAGVTVVGDDGYPSYYDLTAHRMMGASNVEVNSLLTAQVAELMQGKGGDALSLAVYSPASQLNLPGKIVSRLPEHSRCVMPPEEDDRTKLSLIQLDDAVKLVLKYEDFFVGAIGKVGWTDMVTHSIDTGINRPVKQPPRRTNFEEKDQIEHQLSELLLDGKIQASESPWALLYFLSRKKMAAGIFTLTIADLMTQVRKMHTHCRVVRTQRIN